jgi:hypothetical protein
MNIETLESRAYFAAAPAAPSLTLLDAVTDQPIGAFVSGGVLDVSGGHAYSVRADAKTGTGSVQFILDGKNFRTENFAPYSIAGDTGSDYASWIPSAGTHTLKVIPFAGRDAGGLAGVASTITFSAENIQTRATHPLGGNLNSQSDRVQDLAFVDLVKTTRGFYNTAGRNAANGAIDFAHADANGWPTEDFSFTGVDNTEFGVNVDAGTYKMSFAGPAGVVVTGSTGVTPTKLSYTNGIYTYNVVVGTTQKLTLTFKSTQGKVKNIKLFQPGYALSSTQLFTTKYVDFVKAVGPTVLRFMDWTKTNGDPEVNWTDRPKTTDATQAKAAEAGGLQPLKGIAWEYVINFANQLNRSVWINVPAAATDDYVKQLALLFKNTLNSSLTVYVEYSNEVWNTAFPQHAYNDAQTKAALDSNPNTELNYDHLPVNDSNMHIFAERRYARRVEQISVLFQIHFGSAKSRVRMMLDGQASQLGRFNNELAYLKTKYGDPTKYLYGIGIAPYFNLGSTNTKVNATKQDILNAMNASVNNYAKANSSIDNAFTIAKNYGLKLLAYEGGPDTFGAMNIAAKRAASLDPQIQSIIVKYLNAWYAKGGDLFNYYTIGGRSYNSPYGTWSISEDLDIKNSYKIKAFQQVRG